MEDKLSPFLVVFVAVDPKKLRDFLHTSLTGVGLGMPYSCIPHLDMVGL
jgi:hypothetical protein